ncbi:MAG: LysR family transcriptional regulator, partial [Rhodocyclaceae bacterium]|nr:LysR family transcriptional regulator [Rhodocyclaceae bacterium]
MKIRVLHYFLAVAREGNITAAAGALHVTQPTLSRQLAELEEELGVRLFVRRSHGVALTADGLRLRERAEEILDLLEKTRAEFAAPGKPLTGDVHIGCGETREMRHLAHAMQRTQQQWPGIRFHIHSGNFDDVTARLDEGLLDFCLLIEPVDLSKYDSMRLPGKDVWGVITPSDSALAALPHVTRADLL